MAEPTNLTVTEAARALGLSRKTLHNQIDNGVLKPVRDNPRFFLISAEEVERYRREHLGRRGGRDRVT